MSVTTLTPSLVGMPLWQSPRLREEICTPQELIRPPYTLPVTGPLLAIPPRRPTVRSTTAPAARSLSRAASAPPSPPCWLPPRPSSRSVSHLAVLSSVTPGERPFGVPCCASRGVRVPYFHTQRRGAATKKGEDGPSAAGKSTGDGGDGEGPGFDSSDSDSHIDDEDIEGLGGEPAARQETEKRGGGGVEGREDRALREEAEKMGIRWSDGEDSVGDGEDEGSPRDFRSVGTEVFEGGDLEAGETLRGMYDFMDDIVESQHVPTIRDPFDVKGKFHRCPGKKQGKAALPGTCEIFEVKELHVNNTPLLKRFVNDAAMILGRNRTGLCAKCQRKVTKTIKAARQMGLIPTVSEFDIRDTGPGGLYAWAGKGGDHDAMAKAKAIAEANLQKKEKKRFGSLV